MMRFRRWLLALLPLCACSLFTPLSGYSGDADEENSSPDGGTGGVGEDAAAGRSDGDGSTGDGAHDASTDVDSSSPADFCAAFPAGTFCKTFDGEATLAGWTIERAGAGSSVGPTTSSFRSSPRAIRSALGPQGPTRSAALVTELPGSATHARLTYSIYVEARPAVGDIEINILRFLKPGVTYDFYLSVDASGARYVEQRVIDSNVEFNPLPLSRAIPTGAWTDVSLEVRLSSPTSARVTIDGVEALDKQGLTYAQPGSPRVTAGITYAAGQVDQGAIIIDNIAFEILP